MPENKLTTGEQVGYASGILGWSIMINIIAVMLIYFYVPPNNSGLSPLIPQITFLGIFTLLSLIAASGRLLDAITDPLIAYLSDKSQNRKGRRIPFMRVAILPSVVFGSLIFVPLEYGESFSNVWWLTLIQMGFYVSLTVYIIPYNALLPELAPGAEAKVKLSTWLSFAFVLGIIISSQTPALADFFQNHLNTANRHRAFQYAISSLYVLSGIFMFIPTLVIDESKHTASTPATIPFPTAVRNVLTNRNFLVFITADFSYFLSITIISSGMLYFVRVLLFLEEAIGGQVMGVMVLVSLLFYPLVIKLTKIVGKRKLMVASLLMMGGLMIGIFFLGKLPFPPKVQIFGFAVLSAIPVAFLGILPYAIIADIAELDGIESGQHKEAMFFAVRNFSTKLGQTVGIMTFAILTILGKDPYDDLGIRLSAVFGGCLCILSGLIFLRFVERKN